MDLASFFPIIILSGKGLPLLVKKQNIKEKVILWKSIMKPYW